MKFLNNLLKILLYRKPIKPIDIRPVFGEYSEKQLRKEGYEFVDADPVVMTYDIHDLSMDKLEKKLRKFYPDLEFDSCAVYRTWHMEEDKGHQTFRQVLALEVYPLKKARQWKKG